MWKIFFKKPAKAFGAAMTTIFMVLPSLLGCNKPVCPSVCRGQTGRVWAYFSQGLFSFASSYRRT